MNLVAYFYFWSRILVVKPIRRHLPIYVEHFLCTGRRHLNVQAEGGQHPHRFVLLASCNSHNASPESKDGEVNVHLDCKEYIQF